MTQEHASSPERGRAHDPAVVRADQRAAERTDNPAAVVEWGGDGPRGGRLARGLGGLRADRRLVPVLAGLGAIALFASLLSEWRIWTIEQSDENGQPALEPISSGVVSFPAVGTTYLIGLFALAACTTLALLGTGATRRHARLAGLAVAGVLGATLVTAMAHLDQLGGSLEDVLFAGRIADPDEPSGVTYGRGFFLASVGVAAVALALYLVAPRRRAARADWDEDATDDPGPGPDPGAPEGGDDWPWRPRPDRRPDQAASGPVDLTVEPAPPFLTPGDVDGPR